MSELKGAGGDGGGPETPLERERELSDLRAALAAACGGEGRLVVVEGAAGVGKSALWRWAVQEAGRRGMSVLRARGSILERDFSFGVALQLFKRWLHAASERDRSRALAGAAGLARELVQDGRWAGGEPGPDAAAPLIHGLFWLLVNLSDRVPALLAVDDLHWCDVPSLHALHYACQRLDDLPVALLVTRRPAEPGADPLVGELAAHPLALRLSPAPLTETGVTRLLATELGTEIEMGFARACAHTTGGNPFLARALSRTLRDERVAPVDANSGRVAGLRPEEVTRQVLVRIARLGADATAVAQAAAVVGEGTSPALVAALAGLDTDSAAVAADALVAAGLLASSAPISFAHPLLRATVHDQLPPAQRSRLALRAAELLRERGAPAEAIAAQLVAADPGSGLEWAAGVLRAAASSELAAGNPAAAVRTLERALDERLDPATRAELLIELGQAQGLAADPRAAEQLERALELAVDPALVARGCRVLGEALLSRGEQFEAARAFERGLTAGLDPADPITDELRVGWFTAASMDRTLGPRALAHHDGLLQAPPADDTPSGRAVLAALAAQRVVSGGPSAEAIGLARRAWANGRLLEEAGPSSTSWSLVTAGLGWADAFGEALAVLEAVLAAARAQGALMPYVTAAYCAQLPAWMSGDLVAARAYADDVRDGRRHGWSAYLVTSAAVEAEVLVEQGDLAGAGTALAILDEPGRLDEPLSGPGLCARGRLRLLQGRPREALADFAQAGELFGAMGFDNPSMGAWRTGAAVANERLGARRAALELLEAERATAERTGTPTHMARLLRIEAQLRDGAGVLALLSDALDVLAGSEARLERLYCQAARGAALRRAGERADARGVLAGALDDARACQAWLIHERLRDELKVAGARPRRLAFSGVESLTASQLRVARMAAQGMTSPEIAQALFVTPRTVEQHLYNAYKKLGIGSRTELAPVLAQA